MKLALDQRGLLYAGMKLVAQAHDDETTKCELPAGHNHSLDGMTITIQQGGNTITIEPAPGTVLERTMGKSGDGYNPKRMPQRLFGNAILAQAMILCRKFKQHKRLESLLWKVIRKAIRQSTLTEEALTAEIGEKAAEELKEVTAQLREKCPTMPNPSPREIKTVKRGLRPTVSVDRKQRRAG